MADGCVSAFKGIVKFNLFVFFGHLCNVHHGVFGRDRLPVVPGFRVRRLY